MSQHHDPVVIVSAARTHGRLHERLCRPRGARPGRRCHQGRCRACRHCPREVDEVLFGNCLMAGQGQAPARQAGFKGGLPQSTGAVTLSKMCGAGMEATILAAAADRRQPRRDGLRRHGEHDQRPLPAQEGARRLPHGHDKVYDHMMLDGLEDAYEAGRSMGTFGEDCAAKYSFTRAARTPLPSKASSARNRRRKAARFATEITPVTVKTRKGDVTVSIDEARPRPSWTRSPRCGPPSRRMAR